MAEHLLPAVPCTAFLLPSCTLNCSRLALRISHLRGVPGAPCAAFTDCLKFTDKALTGSAAAESSSFSHSTTPSLPCKFKEWGGCQGRSTTNTVCRDWSVQGSRSDVAPAPGGTGPVKCLVGPLTARPHTWLAFTPALTTSFSRGSPQNPRNDHTSMKI